MLVNLRREREKLNRVQSYTCGLREAVIERCREVKRRSGGLNGTAKRRRTPAAIEDGLVLLLQVR